MAYDRHNTRSFTRFLYRTLTHLYAPLTYAEWEIAGRRVTALQATIESAVLFATDCELRAASFPTKATPAEYERTRCQAVLERVCSLAR